MICKYDGQIRAWINAHKEEILEDHMALCRIPSVRGDAEKNAPYGKECARALQASADLFEKNGFSVRVEKLAVMPWRVWKRARRPSACSDTATWFLQGTDGSRPSPSSPV